MKSSYSTQTTMARTDVIGRAIEFLWLGAIFAVPFIITPSGWMLSYVQLPKVALLRTLVALMLAFWALEWAVYARSTGEEPGEFGWRAVKNWLSMRPARWIVITVAVYAVVYALSSLLSSSARVSVWGSSVNVDGYGLHTMLTYIALFMVIAFRMRRRVQMLRVLATIVLAATLVSVIGVLEYVGLLNLGPASGLRIESTFGNPIFFGSFLVMTIPISVALFLRIRTSTAPILAWSLAGVVVGIQLLALVLTLSRGPWVGAAVSLGVFVIAGFFVLKKRDVLLAGTLIVISLLAAFGISRLLSPGEHQGVGTSARASNLSPEERFLSIYSEVAGGGINNRVAIWQASLRLIAGRPWFPNENSSGVVARHLLGYGPDLFSYFFPLESDPATKLPSQAHNHLVHLAVEIGVLGAASFLVIFVMAGVLGFAPLLKRSAVDHADKIIILGLLAALAGRFVEQTVGIARVGDFMLFWVLLGTLTAFLSIAREDAPEADEPSSWITAVDGLRLAKIALACLVIVGLGWVVMTRNVNHVRADFVAADAYAVLDPTTAIGLGDKAVALMPNLPTYHHVMGDLLRHDLLRSNDIEARADVAEKIYVSSYQAWQTDSLSSITMLRLANASLELGRIGYPDKVGDALDIYQKIIDRTPNQPVLHRHLRMTMAVAFIEDGRTQDAIAVLDQVMRQGRLRGVQLANAHYFQGVAYNEMNETSLAIRALGESIASEGDPRTDAASHQLLANIYEAEGDRARSAKHLRQYESLVGAQR